MGNENITADKSFDFAIHGQTAAEVIYNRADAEKDFMGLKTFEGNRPHLKDAVIAKNYLDAIGGNKNRSYILRDRGVLMYE